MSKKIKFKDESEKTLILLVVILSIISGFLASICLWAIQKDSLSHDAKNFTRNLLNFELSILCICAIFIIPVIGPAIGYFGAPVLWVVNVVYCIMAAVAISESKALKLPCYEFIK